MAKTAAAGQKGRWRPLKELSGANSPNPQDKGAADYAGTLTASLSDYAGTLRAFLSVLVSMICSFLIRMCDV